MQRFSIRLPAAFFLLAATALSGAAHAADAPLFPAGEPIVVSASRSGDRVAIDQVGGSVTVLDWQALAARQTRQLADILRDVPGVAVSRMGALGGQTQVRIRGSESNQVLVFIDGIKASDSYQGEFDFATLLAEPMARVEVLRGQQSALYGSDAIGGVISYTTLSGREAPGLFLRGEGGSEATFSAAARLAGVAGETADYALSATGTRTNGYPTAPGGSRALGSSNLALAGKGNWAPSGALRLSAVARYSRLAADINDQGIAATSPIVQGYPVVVTMDTPGRDFTNRAFYGLLRAELDPFDGLWTAALSAQLSDVARDNRDRFGPTFGDRGRRWRGSLENTLRFGSDSLRNRFTLAIDAEREEFHAVDPSGYADTETHRLDTLGVVAQYDLAIGERLALGASARINGSNRFDDSATVRATGSYRLLPGTRLHAAYGSGEKAPNAVELFGYSDGLYIGNPGLRPERSEGWEAGIEQSLGDWLTVGATWFRNRFVDQIETVFTFENGQFLSTTRNNATRTIQKGLEAHLGARAGAVRLDATYSYLKAPQTVEALTGINDGTYQLPTEVETQAVRRPKHIGSLNLAYAPANGPFAANLTVRYNGRQRDYAFTDSYQQLLVDLPAFTLVNADASFDLSPAVQLYGRVENLFDSHYQEVFTYRGMGRTAYGGLRVRF